MRHHLSRTSKLLEFLGNQIFFFFVFFFQFQRIEFKYNSIITIFSKIIVYRWNQFV